MCGGTQAPVSYTHLDVYKRQSWRLSLHTDVEQRYTFEERYAALLRYHDASWINLWNATSAYYLSLIHISFLREYPCPTDAAGGGLLVDDLCHALVGETSCYIFIDDFHLHL